jgi:glycerate 2-kinase
MDVAALLRASFDAALAAADPLQIVGPALGPAPAGRVVVVGAGKAAASMALAVERTWPDAALEGVVITRYAHGLPTQHIRVVEAGHPVPDESGRAAAQEILQRATQLAPSDLLLVLVSGGGSSLIALPVPAVPIGDLQAVTRDLLASGAPIEQMNIVRKHLLQLAGGRLAAAAAERGARVIALIVSDVTGDDPADIASGPCAPDPSTYRDAIEVLERWQVRAPKSIADWLGRGARGEVADTPKPGDARFERVENRVIATARASLAAAADVFRQAGITPVILGDTVTGEAREVAKVYAALVRQIRARGEPFAPPVALISGGECTVTLPPGLRGRGGRCSEFLLSLAAELHGLDGIAALAADTDGIDGSEDNAGAWFESGQINARSAVEAREALDKHDSYGYFKSLGTLIMTGPTRTNVNDFRAIMVR